MTPLLNYLIVPNYFMQMKYKTVIQLKIRELKTILKIIKNKQPWHLEVSPYLNVGCIGIKTIFK